MPEAQETELTLAPREDIRVGVPVAGTVPEDEPAHPLEMLLDRLHGRWLWVAITAGVLAPTLAAAGFFLTPVKYSASGVIGIEGELDPVTEKIHETESPTNFSALVEEQAMSIKSDRVLQQAINDARMARYAQRITERGAGDIARGLSVFPNKGTGLVNVVVEADDPNFAADAVNCIIDAAIEVTSPDRQRDVTEKIEANRTNLTKTRQEIDDKNLELLQLFKTSTWGTGDLKPLVETRVKEMERLKGQLVAIDASIERLKLSAGDTGVEPPPEARLAPTQGELDQVNPSIPKLRAEIDQASMQLELARKSYASRHPIIQNIEKKLTLFQTQLERETDSAREAWASGSGTSMSFGELKAARAKTEASIDGVRAEINSMNETMAQAEKIRRTLSQLAEDENRFSERWKELLRERDTITKSRVSVRWKAAPNYQPSKDRRLPFAGAGFVGGIVLAIGAFFLWGTVDRRAFGTRQLAGTNPGKLLCAGAIPDMSSLKDDPENKDLASNCVHRIRTRIESRRTPGDGYALMVSSPFQGDGKTTLAVALAWSYAESGSRTLLVDCDFIGQALSFQFGRLAAVGVREALQGQDLAGLITEVGDSLWMLPVGRDRHFGASRVHPTGLRRLFRELRNRYDVIVVDTGPMTASIEALPVASAVDGVVLSLRRGRSRQRLDECIADIGSVGAEYLGVVLNYADRKDCMKYGSVSRMSADVTRALEGQQGEPPRHPLLQAIQSPGDRNRRREGDAA